MIDSKVKIFETSIKIFNFPFFDLLISRELMQKHFKDITVASLTLRTTPPTLVAALASVPQSVTLAVSGHSQPALADLASAALPATCFCCGMRDVQALDMERDPVICTITGQRSYVRDDKDVYLTSGDGGNDLDEFELPSVFDEALLAREPPTPNEWESIHFEGGPVLSTKLKALVKRYANKFSSVLREKPASVIPYRINLKDDNNWETTRHRLTSRPYSQAQREEMNRQIQAMLEAALAPQVRGVMQFLLKRRTANGDSAWTIVR